MGRARPGRPNYVVDPISNWLVSNFKMSYREAEVVMLVSRGLRNAEIACALFVSEKTIKFHLTNCYKLMGVKSRTEAMSLIYVKGPRPEEVAPAAPVAPPTPAYDYDTLPAGAI